MKKLNKKGFTLVEMLVVIAIIAVLVAIIIPTTSSATTKAAAATNAANLRSLLAEATVDYLGGVNDETGFLQYNASDSTFTTLATAPAAKKVGTGTNAFTSNEPAKAVVDSNGIISVYYGNNAKYNIAYFSAVAETGKVS